VNKLVVFLFFIFITELSLCFDYNIQENQLDIAVKYNNLNINSKLNPNSFLNFNEYESSQRYILGIKGTFDESCSYYLKTQVDNVTAKYTTRNVQAIFSEYYVSWIPASALYLDLGKKAFGWGNTIAWNLHSVLSLRDMWSCQYFIDEKLSTIFVKYLNSSDWATKVRFTPGVVDCDIYAYQENEVKKAGLSLSHTVDDALEIHGEALIQRANTNYYPTYYGGNQYGWIQKNVAYSFNPQVIVGCKYTTLENVDIWLDYCYNSMGLSNAEMQTFLNGINESLLGNKYQITSSWMKYLGDANSYYQFARFRQNYIFMRLAKDKLLDSISTELIGYYCVDDGGAVFIPTVTNQFSSNLSGGVSIFIPLGDDHSEFKRYQNYYVNCNITYFF